MRRSARAALLVPRSRPSRPVRRSARLLAVAAAASALALSGCEMMSPVQTLVPYEPADGVSATVGTVGLSDLLVVSTAKGSPGVVSGRAVNSGDKEVTLQVTAPNNPPVSAVVPAHGHVQLSGSGVAVDLSSVGTPPGALITLSIGSPSAGTSSVQVPVLLPNGPYATITPTPK